MNERVFTEEKEAEDFFYGFSNHFWDLGLENLRAFLERVGHPENHLKVIQVAGTNGKGSVSTYLTEILMQAGFKVGTYNSPAVFEKRENITMNRQPMPPGDFVHVVNTMQKAMTESEKEGKLPTIFELETALAYTWFYQQNCDFVVMECGLGGKTDATNVTDGTILSVITSISMDHMKYLGNTLEEIAGCKAGIIKESVPVVCAPQREEALEVIKRAAMENHAPFRMVDKEAISVLTESLDGETFFYSLNGEKKQYETIMAGRCQTENAALALEAAEMLKKSGVMLSQDDIRNGLKNAKIPGRFEVLQKKPLVILDGAHNPDAAARLKENILTFLDDYYIIYIFGVFADKDYLSVIHETCPLADEIYAVDAVGSRALPKAELADRLRQCGDVQAKIYVCERKEAVSQIFKNTPQKKVAVIAFGSLSYLSQIKKYIAEETENENK